MFCAGSDNENGAELRPSSFKGVLRFWWRALHHTTHPNLRDAEGRLFGASDQDIGQSKVLLKLEHETIRTLENGSELQYPENDRKVGEGARYLGYGVMEAFGRKGGNLTRACLQAPFEFKARLLFKPKATTDQIEEVVQSLKALGLLGSMGSKSRKGYGSLTLTRLSGCGEEWSAPQSRADYARELSTLLNQAGRGPEPDLTGFSEESRVLILSGRRLEPLRLLDIMGKEQVRYRSWGHNGKVLGHSREELFKDDHDLMKKPLKDRKTHPSRVAFGLPHNYGHGAEPRNTGDVAASGYDRRASPLFYHIHQASEDAEALGAALFLPSRFLPPGTKIQVGGPKVPVRDNLWEPIHTFLERLKSPEKRKENFTEVHEVTRG